MLRAMIILVVLGLTTAWVARARDVHVPLPAEPVPAEDQVAALPAGVAIERSDVLPERGWCVIAFTATW